MKRIAALLAGIAFVLAGCSPGQPTSGNNNEFTVTGYARAITDSEFNAMSAEQQYQIVSKVLATIYKGMPVDEFFDLSAGLSAPQVRFTNGLSKIRTALATNLAADQAVAIDAMIDGIDSEGNPNPGLARYLFDSQRARELPLARIHEYPISRDGFAYWMAYFLTNTIMFSPALEMESTDIVNAQNTFRRLVTGIQGGRTVREIVRSHLPTVDRWRVSRSAENHALEAYELYLGLFDTEEDSRRGGIACKDLYLTDEDAGYQLTSTLDPNREEQLILGAYFVTSCDDFHDVIAGHPLLLPRVTEVIVNYLMDERTQAERLQMVESITNSGATTFEHIFTAILFSREYLFGTERPKSFEENLMPMLDTLKWDPRFNAGSADERIFDRMATDTNNRLFLGGMGWPTMSLKIGRTPFVPLDALSFANYHKAIRESFMRNTSGYTGRVVTVQVEDGAGGLTDSDVVVNGLTRVDDGTGADVILAPYIADTTPQDFLHMLFLSTLQRRASDVEIADLMAFFGADGKNWIRDVGNDGDLDVPFGQDDDIVRETVDYVSRLPEFYYFKNMN